MSTNTKIALGIAAALALYFATRKKAATPAASVTGGGVQDLRYSDQPAGSGVSETGGCGCDEGDGIRYRCECDDPASYGPFAFDTLTDTVPSRDPFYSV